MVGIKLIDIGTERALDTLQIVLLHQNQYSLLPELYEIFGKEQLIEFLAVFAGATIQVPSLEVLENAVRDVQIYRSMQEARFKPEMVHALAEQFGLDETSVRRIADTVGELVKQYDLRKIAKELLDARIKGDNPST